MELVINWNPPKGLSGEIGIEEFFKEKGIPITVIQAHRVPSGKLNTTFSGDPKNIQSIWNFCKQQEVDSIMKRRKPYENESKT